MQHDRRRLFTSGGGGKPDDDIVQRILAMPKAVGFGKTFEIVGAGAFLAGTTGDGCNLFEIV